MRKPDGSTEEVGENDGSNLYDLLHINDVLNAELWNGSIIQLDDGSGHYLMATDNPVVTGTLLPIVGVCAIGGGGILLALLIRALRRAGVPSSFTLLVIYLVYSAATAWFFIRA